MKPANIATASSLSVSIHSRPASVSQAAAPLGVELAEWQHVHADASACSLSQSTSAM